MKIYLSISLIVSLFFMVLFGANVCAVLLAEKPASDLMVHVVLFVLFTFQAIRSFRHLKNTFKVGRNENLQ